MPFLVLRPTTNKEPNAERGGARTFWLGGASASALQYLKVHGGVIGHSYLEEWSGEMCKKHVTRLFLKIFKLL